MRLTPLFYSVTILISFSLNAAEAKGLGDLFTNNASIVCNSTGNNGTPGCPANQGAGIVDTLSTDQGAGNPINVLNGNKFEQATDIQAVGDDYALRLNRYYNSRSSQRGMLGIGWRHDYEMQLQDIDDQIDIIQADGRKISFTKTAAALGSSTLFVTRYVADKSELGYIERSQSSNPSKATWIWTLPTGKQFEFVIHKQINSVNQLGMSRYGQLSRVTEQADDPSSPYWALTYGVDGKLAQVRNHNGDTLKFAYETTKSGLPKISVTSSTIRQNNSNNNNSASKWVYLLDQKGNLAQVVSPTGVRTGYQYNDPYDAHNLTAKYSYENKQPQLITQWTYDAYDRATSSTHKDGVKKVSVVYDNDTVIPTQANHIFTNVLTNSIGETTNYRYRYKNGEAQLLSVTGAGCVTCGPTNVSYEYDSAGRVTKTSKLDDNGQVIASTSTTFDEFGRITKRMIISDDASPTQSAIHYKYVSNNPEDSRFALIAKEWQDSVAANRQTGISYVYDNHGRPIEKTEFGHTPDGISISRTYLMSYDSKGNLTQVALRDDDNLESTIVIEAYTWFADGSVKTSARPNLGQITTFEHNANGQTTAIERKNNQETMTINIEYGDNNLPMTISRYFNSELINGVKYQRNSQGDITNVSDLDNNFIASYAYDDARRNLGEITAKQATLRHLDTEGRPIVDYKMSATGTDKLSYIYDNKNRITAVGRDDTQLVAVNYSADNKIAQILGASGEQTIVHNDKSQISDYSLPNMWDMLGVKKTTIKTVQSGVTRVEQNDNITTDYGVDDFGRISYIDSGTAGRKHYKYDARDQLTGIELANGVIISYQYDEKGRRVHKTVKQEGKVVQQVAWEFDDKDQLLSAKGSNQHIEYQYDNQGRVTQKRLSLADLATPLVTSYRYDKDGSMISTTLPDGIEILSHNNQIRYKAPDDIKATAIYSQSTHQASGINQTSYQLGQHIVMGHFYDDNGQFSGLSYRNIPKSGDNPFIRSARADDITPLFSQQWQRTSDGIVGQVTELDYQAKPTERNYLYDSQYHLIASSYQPIELDDSFTQVSSANKQTDDQANNDSIEARYIYDELGNRMLGIDDSKTLKKYQYDDRGRLTAITPIAQTADSQNVGAQSIAYDAAGLPTQYGVYKLSYSAGQLSQVKDKSGKLVAEYSYNDDGQRIKKTVYQKDDKLLATPETSYYVYEDSQLQHELDGQGNIIRHYLYIGNTLTATIDYPKGKHGELLTPEQPNISLWTRGKNWVSKLWTQESAYPSINYVITDYLGRPRQVRDGETNLLKWQFTPTAFGGQVDDSIKSNNYELNVRFPGQYEDTETGLYYNHWRYYDQDTGRYLSADPLGLGGGENLYAYVNATPTHFIDPPGLLLFAFDGTGNQDYGKGTYASNVVKFRDAYRADPNEPSYPNTTWTGQKVKFGEFAKNNAFYISGVGTTDRYTGVDGGTLGNVTDAGVGISMNRRSNRMVLYLQHYLQKVADQYKDNQTKVININLDIVGFSRGAATARMFANKVEQLMDGNNDPYVPFPAKWRETTKWLKNSCNVNFKFNFMGLWDTVPAYEPDATTGVNSYNDGTELELEISNKWKRVVQAVAVNEHRSGFHGRSIFNSQKEANAGDKKNRIERGFLGAHADIGGGYPEGDLSDVALMWVVKEAELAGVKKLDVPGKYKYVQTPTVHDSVGVFGFLPQYKPNRDFLWANQGEKRGNQEQFNNFNHLKLNWSDTLKYQNKEYVEKNGGKFEDIRELLDDFDKEEYMALKKNKTIVYDGSVANEKIRIKAYVKWVNDTYGTKLVAK